MLFHWQTYSMRSEDSALKGAIWRQICKPWVQMVVFNQPSLILHIKLLLIIPVLSGPSSTCLKGTNPICQTKRNNFTLTEIGCKYCPVLWFVVSEGQNGMRTRSTLQFKILNATWIIRDKAAWSSKVCHVSRQHDQRGLFSLRSHNSVFHFRIKCVMKKVCWTTADTSCLLHPWNSLWAEKKLWDCEVEEAGLGETVKISYPDFFHDKTMILIWFWFLKFFMPV